MRFNILLAGMLAFAGTAQAEDVVIAGRWTLAKGEKLSKAAAPYARIDVGGCEDGATCGVAVDKAGKCGATLFKLKPSTYADDARLVGDGQWGDEKHQTFLACQAADGGNCSDLSLTISHRFSTYTNRAGSMPLFSEDYARAGEASCVKS